MSLSIKFRRVLKFVYSVQVNMMRNETLIKVKMLFHITDDAYYQRLLTIMNMMTQFTISCIQ